MTTDILTYCKDTNAFVAELLEKYPTWVDVADPDNPRFLIDKAAILVRNNNDETLGLVRCEQENIDAINTLDTLEILGTYEEVFADPDKTAIYDRVYDQTPVAFTDDEGVEHTYTPPRKFVEIA